MRSFVTVIFLALLTSSCDFIVPSDSELKGKTKNHTEDPLPSWNEGITKTSIIEFVNAVSKEGSSSFVPVEDRIATFDNDGTLWAEQPAYFQLYFAVDQIKKMASDHPEWSNEEPFKSVLNDDLEGLKKSGLQGLLEIVMKSHAGMTSDAYQEEVKLWIKSAKHPRFKVKYTDLVYQPMLELLDYLRLHDFKLFIVSGGGIDFMRVWASEIYGIPSDQIIGSSIKTTYDYAEGRAEIKKLPEINFIDDKDAKPIGIYTHIGKKPILAAGNSDGDIQMLQYSDSSPYSNLQLYVHHTDSIREWAYDRGSHIGQLDKGLDEAQIKDWFVIDMENDWSYVFPFERTP